MLRPGPCVWQRWRCCWVSCSGSAQVTFDGRCSSLGPTLSVTKCPMLVAVLLHELGNENAT
jgi:hypothetical protein